MRGVVELTAWRALVQWIIMNIEQKDEQKEGVHVAENNGLRNERREHAYMLPGSILVAAFLISGSVLYLVGALKGNTLSLKDGAERNSQGALVAETVPTPENLSVTERDVVLGGPKAPVTLIEYGDYQCPFCARFFDQTERVIVSEYIEKGKVKMVFRNFQFLGPESVAAGEAAECAKEEGKFWAFHNALYEEELRDGEEHNGNLNRALFLRIAGELGLSKDIFAKCVDERKYADLIEKDYDAAQAIGVNSTPTSFVNGALVKGAQPFPVFQAAIENALAEK